MQYISEVAPFCCTRAGHLLECQDAVSLFAGRAVPSACGTCHPSGSRVVGGKT